MREKLFGEAGKSIEIHVVWTKVLKGDCREIAQANAPAFVHDGVFQYWDEEQAVGGHLASVVGVGDSPLAWDVYLFFEAGATWDVGCPALWAHQLHGADPSHFAGGRIGERLEAHLRALCGTAAERAEAALAFLRKAGSVDGPCGGEGGDRSATYAAYERLRDHAAQETLIALCSDGKAVVRCYAVQALAERFPDVDLLSILRAHVDDLQRVETLGGCEGATEKAGDVMIRLVNEHLTEAQRLALVEALLESKLDERRRSLSEMTFPADWRPRLRSLAGKGDDAALIALARYRNPDDLGLITAALGRPGTLADRFDALEAATVYPDASLLPALARHEQAALDALKGNRPGQIRAYIAALSAQKSKEAAAILARLGDPLLR